MTEQHSEYIRELQKVKIYDNGETVEVSMTDDAHNTWHIFEINARLYVTACCLAIRWQAEEITYREMVIKYAELENAYTKA